MMALLHFNVVILLSHKIGQEIGRKFANSTRGLAFNDELACNFAKAHQLGPRMD